MDGLSCHGVRIAYDDRYQSIYEEMLSLHGIVAESWSVRPGTHSGTFVVRDRRFIDFCVLEAESYDVETPNTPICSVRFAK